MKRFKGTAAAPGLACGRVLVVDSGAPAVARTPAADAEAEGARLDGARALVTADIQATLDKAEADGLGSSDAKILRAHIKILADDEFYGEAKQLARSQAVCIEWALQEVTNTVAARFAAMKSDYLKERARDIEQTSAMIIRQLMGVRRDLSEPAPGDDKLVLVARDLAPSDTLKFDRARLGGIVTEIGGVTSHTVILAKSLGIPAVTNVAGLFDGGPGRGEPCIVDGFRGEVVASPDAGARARFAEQMEGLQARRRQEDELRGRPSMTRDGTPLPVQGNLAEPAGCDAIIANGAEGVGLFRSEFLFMNRRSYPTEDEQYAAYRAVAEKLDGRPLTIRTLDIGGDKPLDYLELPREANPFLGYRAIRISLDRQAMFLDQLRAILRAGVHGNVVAMLPMIVSIEELRAAKALWAEAQRSLAAAGVPFRGGMPLGIMIETPAAAVLAEDLARECDFFSIGSNDLIQYVTACDRLNPKVQHLYNGCNPAVLRLMAGVAAAGRQRGIPVSICGELASDLRMVPLLVGMEVSKLSVSAGSILPVKLAVSTTDSEQARTLLRDVLTASSESDVAARLDAFVRISKSGGSGATGRQIRELAGSAALAD